MFSYLVGDSMSQDNTTLRGWNKMVIKGKHFLSSYKLNFFIGWKTVQI